MTDHDPPTTPLRAGRRAPRGRMRAVLLVAALLLVATVPWWSVGSALAVPGSDSVAARLAEWGRDHGLGGVITWLEGVQYQLNPPPLGGTPAGGSRAPPRPRRARRRGGPGPCRRRRR